MAGYLLNILSQKTLKMNLTTLFLLNYSIRDNKKILLHNQIIIHIGNLNLNHLIRRCLQIIKYQITDMQVDYQKRRIHHK
jgi:hypothetical protein